MRFAFEAEPRKCFERIGSRMPFGAHRWQKFDRAFYEPHLLHHGPGSEVRVAAGSQVATRSFLPSGVANQ
jgi:hypothetical protein